MTFLLCGDNNNGGQAGTRYFIRAGDRKRQFNLSGLCTGVYLETDHHLSLYISAFSLCRPRLQSTDSTLTGWRKRSA